MKSSHLGNGPDCPPVLYGSDQDITNEPDQSDQCRSCHSPSSIITDWAQGDRVCTHCGVIAESHIREDRPEWNDYIDDSGVASSNIVQRSGLVAVNDSRYLGGLQPTRLSKQPFGGATVNGGYGEARRLMRLRKTNRKMDTMMDRINKKNIQDTKLEHSLMRKRKRERAAGDVEADESIRPEYDQLLLQEEEEAHRMHAKLYADKWSLSRAILLFGNGEATEGSAGDEDLIDHMDKTLRKSSQELYQAYKLVSNAASTLQLPKQVETQAINQLVQYATRRDGFPVKGVSSRLSTKDAIGRPEQRKQAQERLRQFNSYKKMASLGASIVFLIARQYGWTRSLQEVCSSFVPSSSISGLEQLPQNGTLAIKAKHVSSAVKELKSTFPDFAKAHMHGPSLLSTVNAPGPNNDSNESPGSSHDSSNSKINFCDHQIRKLQLPPVAEGSIRVLLLHLMKEGYDNHEQSSGKGLKQLSKVCGAVAFFVCSAGSVMQRLSNQMHAQPTGRGSLPLQGSTSESLPRKRAKTASNLKVEVKEKSRGVEFESDAEDDVSNTSSIQPATVSSEDSNEPDDDEPFDVFTHSAHTGEERSDTLKYEMRRMWDAWSEQIPWQRSLAEVEQACGISRSLVLECYQTRLFPKRQELLNLLKDSTKSNDSALREAPLAPILLNHISTAAPSLMSSK